MTRPGRNAGRRTASAVAALVAFAVAAAAVAALPAAALDVPELRGRVNDHAGMIPVETAARIEARLAAFEQATGAQIAVLTIPALEGEALEEYSLRVAETWALGRQGVDDGVLLLVARDDRKMRIEVGYGLEADLTDAESGRILNNVLRPAFRAGDFGRGIEEGVEAIVGTLEGREVIPAEAPAAGGLPSNDLPAAMRLGMGIFFLLFFLPFISGALLTRGCAGWFLYFFLMPFLGIFPSAFVHPAAGVGALALWIVGFPIAWLMLHKSAAGKRFLKRHPRWLGTGGFSGGGSSGGFSGGGFSGGGGSFGGGGASSSW